MSVAVESSQYLTFKLDQELFAVDIGKVREVLEFTTVTKVPRTPEFVRGVINLRGNVVPVVDMRLKLGLTQTEKTVDTCVVITEVEVDGKKPCLGRWPIRSRRSSSSMRARSYRRPAWEPASIPRSFVVWANATTTS